MTHVPLKARTAPVVALLLMTAASLLAVPDAAAFAGACGGRVAQFQLATCVGVSSCQRGSQDEIALTCDGGVSGGSQCTDSAVCIGRSLGI